jgi:hypothetical protein
MLGCPDPAAQRVFDFTGDIVAPLSSTVSSGSPLSWLFNIPLIEFEIE